MMGLIDAIKIGAGAILGAALIAGPAYLGGKSAGRQEAAAIAASEAINRIQELEKNNASFRALPSRDRCLALMRDSGLPDSECDQR
jgi:hypothetical protein